MISTYFLYDFPIIQSWWKTWPLPVIILGYKTSNHRVPLPNRDDSTTNRLIVSTINQPGINPTESDKCVDKCLGICVVTIVSRNELRKKIAQLHNAPWPCEIIDVTICLRNGPVWTQSTESELLSCMIYCFVNDIRSSIVQDQMLYECFSAWIFWDFFVLETFLFRLNFNLEKLEMCIIC